MDQKQHIWHLASLKANGGPITAFRPLVSLEVIGGSVITS